MPNARPDFANELSEIDRPHAEVIDPTTRQVWQSLEPCGPDELARLELPEPLRPAGTGIAAMDEHWFDRSPGATKDGPMETRRIGDGEWGRCAAPKSAPTRPFGEAGPLELSVDKHHALRFAAGRRVPVLQTAEGAFFVHVIVGGDTSTVGVLGTPSKEGLVVPDGCRLGEVALAQDWVVRLPNPTRALFFSSGDSFQGPLDALPASWAEVE